MARLSAAASAATPTAAAPPPAAALRGAAPGDDGGDVGAWFGVRVGREAFVQVLRGLVPQWQNDGTTRHADQGGGAAADGGKPPTLVDRLFAIFLELPADGRQEADLTLDRREIREGGGGGGDAGGGGASAGGGAPATEPPTAATVLTFEQMVGGLSWLLRGTSAKRAQLCFRCFAGNEGSGAAGGRENDAAAPPPPATPSDALSSGAEGTVLREQFAALLRSVYHMYEKAWPIPPDAEARIDSEARQFVEMMFELWDETRGGALSADAFDRAAHQHPLLVQAFQLEQLDMPALAGGASPASPIGEAALRIKNGVYLGLRPGAVSTIDDSYF